MAASAASSDYAESGSAELHHRKRRSHHRSSVDRRRGLWPESSVTTAAGAALGLDSEREHDRLYRATLHAVTNGLVIGRGRHGVVVALTDDPADAHFSLAVKIVSKVFMPSKGKEPSFHRVVAHTLHLQNEVAAMAKLSAGSTFVLPLYCAFQDDGYVFLVMERACCSLKQLIQHADGAEREMLLSFQEAHPLKFLSFGLLTTVALLHACWTLQRARLIHHDIHPAQLLITADGRPRLADLGQCSVIPPDGRKQLLPPLGRRDFCRPAKLGPLQGAEVDGYGAGATLWVTWRGCYDGGGRVQRDWNRHEERERLQERLEFLAARAAETTPAPRWPFAQRVQDHLRSTTPRAFAASVRAMIEALVTACQEEGPPTPVSTFSAEGAFAQVAPFVPLDAALATDPAATLDPTNFALPSVAAEDPWPPPDDATLAPVYHHAVRALRAGEGGGEGGGGRRRSGRATLPSLPEVPIALNATPCVSMLLHPGRLLTGAAEPLLRIALVSMLVRDALPDELTVIVRARPWVDSPAETVMAEGAVMGAAHADGAAAAGARDAGSDGAMGADGAVVLEFVVGRHEFLQEGPSGPVEAKRQLLLPALPLPRMRLSFELAHDVANTHGFCPTPPLLVERRQPHPAD